MLMIIISTSVDCMALKLSKDLIMFPSISSSTNKDTAHIKGTGLGPQLIHKFAFAQQSNKHTK